MQTSAQGVAAIEDEEGVVLKAYRCPAGHWTIGAGLTAASGVVKPKAGMVITREAATGLLQMALDQNYEPAVAKVMPGAAQHAFDAGVSFHFNTGAIARATWVKLWRGKGTPSAIRTSLAAWNKGGGKVLPGLVRRREREADMLLQARYPATSRRQLAPEFAKWALDLTATERDRVRAELRRLGFTLTGDTNADHILAADVIDFQRAHDLTPDGIIGRATLSTLQRRIDARGKAVGATTAAVAATPVATTDLADQIAGLPMAGPLVGIGVALWCAWLAFTYRDAVAAAIHRPLPRLAALLRSF